MLFHFGMEFEFENVKIDLIKQSQLIIIVIRDATEVDVCKKY